MKRSGFFFLVCLSGFLLSNDLLDRNPFPEIERYKLKNGLEVIFADYGELPVTNLTFFVNAGTKSETPGQQGLSSLTANTLGLGNEKYGRVEQDRLLYRLGGNISISPGDNVTAVSGAFLNKDIEKGMDLLSGVMLNPLFPLQDIEEIKGFEMSQNKPAKMDIGALAGVYGNYFTYGIAHPFGRHAYETQYKKIGVSQLKEFYSFNYTPANTKLIVTGKPDRELVKKLVEKYFGEWTAAYGEVNGASYDIPAIKSKEYAFVQKTGATQACLEWMKRAPEAGAKDMTAFKMANAIFSDRLNNEIREKRGYTYGIYSSYSETANNGIFRAKTQVRNEVMFSTKEAFDQVLNEFFAKGITEEELKKFKTMVRADLLSIEDPGSLAALMNPWVYRDYSKRRQYLTELDALDVATVNKAIKKYFSPDSYKLIVAGDEAALGTQLTKFPNLQRLGLDVIEHDQ
jgi:zinc protease